jgi:hypothetical protein
MTITPAAGAEGTTMQTSATADDGYLRNSATPGRVPIASSARIFTTCDITHLLVIQHLRRHLPSMSIRDYLIWYPTENNRSIDEVMTSVISSADFADSLDIRHGASLQPRTHSRAQWLPESPRRLRADATMLHRWMDRNGIAEETTELWAAEPFHFNVIFARGMLRRAIHVKIPHCFNFEDATSPSLKEKTEAPWREAPWAKKYLYFPWLHWMSGMNMRIDRIVYDRAYTFAEPSPWSANSVDLSSLISIDAFARTYRGLPPGMRAEVESMLAPIRAGAKPLVLLLLFGLGAGDELRELYQRSIARLFTEHATELRNCTLAVKVHPNAQGDQERVFTEWLKTNVPAQIHEIRHRLNLEFMLPQLSPDYVMAGLCGSLPIVRDLRAGRAIMLAELLDAYIAEHRQARGWMAQFMRGIEVW